MNLDRLLELAHQHAERALVGKNGASLPPTFVIEFKSRPATVLVLPWRSDHEKNHFLTGLAMMMKLYRGGITAYSAVSEAWVVEQLHAPRPGDRPPSDRDDRKEMVFAVASDGTEQKFKSWEIMRGPDAVITALTLRAQQLGALAGRMANLLDPE